MSKSAVYDRGLMLTLTELVKKMPDIFTITSLTNEVMKIGGETLDARQTSNLRDRIKRQMEYLEANGKVTSKVIEQDGIVPPYITQYTKPQ